MAALLSSGVPATGACYCPWLRPDAELVAFCFMPQIPAHTHHTAHTSMYLGSPSQIRYSAQSSNMMQGVSWALQGFNSPCSRYRSVLTLRHQQQRHMQKVSRYPHIPRNSTETAGAPAPVECTIMMVPLLWYHYNGNHVQDDVFGFANQIGTMLHVCHQRSLYLAVQASMHTCPKWWGRCPQPEGCLQTATSLPMACLGLSVRV